MLYLSHRGHSAFPQYVHVWSSSSAPHSSQVLTSNYSSIFRQAYVTATSFKPLFCISSSFSYWNLRTPSRNQLTILLEAIEVDFGVKGRAKPACENKKPEGFPDVIPREVFENGDALASYVENILEAWNPELLRRFRNQCLMDSRIVVEALFEALGTFVDYEDWRLARAMKHKLCKPIGYVEKCLEDWLYSRKIREPTPERKSSIYVTTSGKIKAIHMERFYPWCRKCGGTLTMAGTCFPCFTRELLWRLKDEYNY